MWCYNNCNSDWYLYYITRLINAYTKESTYVNQ